MSQDISLHNFINMLPPEQQAMDVAAVILSVRKMRAVGATVNCEPLPLNRRDDLNYIANAYLLIEPSSCN